MRLVFLGRPGAGKGTQAGKVVKEHDVTHVSTGDLLRAAMKEGTPLGAQAKDFVEKGQLVPDDVVVKLVEERLAALGAEASWLLDGFPRNVAQAGALDEVVATLGQKIDAVVSFSVKEETVVERLSGRRMCSKCGKNWHVTFIPPREEGRCDDPCGGELIQRKDDRPEAIRERLAIYDKETAPLIDFYQKQGLLVEIPSDDDEQAIASRVSEKLAALSN